MDNEIKDTGCCPPFNPEPWDGKILDWNDKKFVKGKVFTFFYMPLTFGKVIVKLFEKVTAVGAQNNDNLCLSDHTSKWNMDIYLSVTKEVPGLENISLSGKYISKVYEGNFKETGKWHEDFMNYVKSLQMETDKIYMWYTTCPKCAKQYGKNYVVVIGKAK